MMIAHVIYILVLHFFADYLCQSSRLALGKSKDLSCLLEHVGIYGMVLAAGLFFILDPKDALYFSAISAVLHFLVDRFTSPAISRMFRDQKYYTELPNLGVFSMMGFDQLLHQVCLILLYSLIV